MNVKTATSIEYFGEAQAEGGKAVWDKDRDDPTSDAFVPMEKRSPGEVNRWWAMQNRKMQQRQASAEMDG